MKALDNPCKKIKTKPNQTSAENQRKKRGQNMRYNFVSRWANVIIFNPRGPPTDTYAYLQQETTKDEIESLTHLFWRHLQSTWYVFPLSPRRCISRPVLCSRAWDLQDHHCSQPQFRFIGWTQCLPYLKRVRVARIPRCDVSGIMRSRVTGRNQNSLRFPKKTGAYLNYTGVSAWEKNVYIARLVVDLRDSTRTGKQTLPSW